MEKLRRLTNEIAYTPPSQRRSHLSSLQLSLIPLLSFASSLYKLAVSLRRRLYHLGFLRQHRLAVPVISVGNLTWGGNGKTPMVEFIARFLVDSGIPPLILTRGYAGGDEARMLQRHLLGTPAKIGVGANRAATAVGFIDRYGYMDICIDPCLKGYSSNHKSASMSELDKIGIAILDDGMQHLSLWRDLEIVMINGMSPWGNKQLLPLGPLREPLTALRRADIAVVHHANLVSTSKLKTIESTLRSVKESLTVFFTRMAPLYFIRKEDTSCNLPLSTVHNMVLFCVCAIGFADAFLEVVKKIGPVHMDQLVFSDHHVFQIQDMEIICSRLKNLQTEFGSKPRVIITEKDYDRDPEIFKCLDPFEVLVLCCELQIEPQNGLTEDGCKTIMRQLLAQNLSRAK